MNSEVIANSQFRHLKPPEAAIAKNDRGVYEIYVSKFHSEQSEDGIANHIVEKTGINIGKFRVIKLTSRRDPKNNYYASFKIVTIDVNAYNSISDQMLWGEYEVRDFEPDKPKKLNNQRMMKKRSVNNHREPRQVNGRDMRKNILERNTFVNHGRYENQNNFQTDETPRRPLKPRFGARYVDSPQRQYKIAHHVSITSHVSIISQVSMNHRDSINRHASVNNKTITEIGIFKTMAKKNKRSRVRGSNKDKIRGIELQFCEN